MDFDSLEMYIVCPCRIHWLYVHHSPIENRNCYQRPCSARCVGSFALNSPHFDNGFLPLQHGQDKNLLSGLVLRACLGVVDNVDPVTAAEVEKDLLLVLILLSSTFGLLAPETFIRSWASAFRFSQSLKSISVDSTMSFTTVYMDHCSRRFGDSL